MQTKKKVVTNFGKLPYDLNIQFFAEGGEGGAGDGVQQISFEPQFGMTEFNDFLANNKDAQTFFQAKLDNGLEKSREALRAEALEQAKKELSQAQQKPAWEIEMDKLRAENEAIRQQGVTESIKTELSNRVATASIPGLDVGLVHELCLKGTAEDSYATFDKVIATINSAAKELTDREIEKRMGGYASNPMSGKGTASQTVAQSTGARIASEIAAMRANNNTRSSKSAEHYKI